MALKAENDAGDTGTGGVERYRRGETSPRMWLTIRLVLAGRRWRALLDEKLRPTGQSAARMEAMSAILNVPEPRPQVDIARRLRIEGPTLTRMLDALEKDGMVERLPDPSDRRTKQLRLTDHGEEALEEIFAIADCLRSRLLDGFSDAELDTVNRFLARLMERLDGRLEDCS
jgi:MarR family transcriptional regulator for hemolysin